MKWLDREKYKNSVADDSSFSIHKYKEDTTVANINITPRGLKLYFVK